MPIKVSDQGPLREQCLTQKAKPQAMRQRAALVEHPFGTLKLKHRAGINHFLVKRLTQCRGEFNLMVLTYNFTRVLNILGSGLLRDYCIQRQGNALQNVNYG